jgi:hypothetical protein
VVRNTTKNNLGETKMKKTHTFKNFAIDGIEDTYNVKVKVANWELTIDVDGDKTKYLLEEESQGITKEEALNYLQQYFEMTIELETI